MSLLAMVAPGHDLEPAPKDKCGVLETGFSVYEADGDAGGSSQRSGLNVPAFGPQ